MGSQPIRIQPGKILWEILAGKSYGKFLWKNLSGKSCGKFLQDNLEENSCGKILQEIVVGNAVGNLVGNCGNLAKKVLMVCNGSKNGKKKQPKLTILVIFAIFRPVTAIKTLQKYFIL